MSVPLNGQQRVVFPSTVQVAEVQVRKLQLQAGDIVVVRPPKGLDAEQLGQLQEVFTHLGAERRVRFIVDDIGCEFEIVTPSRLVTA